MEGMIHARTNFLMESSGESNRRENMSGVVELERIAMVMLFWDLFQGLQQAPCQNKKQ